MVGSMSKETYPTKATTEHENVFLIILKTPLEIVNPLLNLKDTINLLWSSGFFPKKKKKHKTLSGSLKRLSITYTLEKVISFVNLFKFIWIKDNMLSIVAY